MKMRLQQAFSTLVRGQHREFRKEILQAMRVGVWANTENFEKKFYRQCELGCGPQQREMDSQFLQTMQVGGAPT